MRIRLPHGFEPRPYQRRPMAFLDGGGKRVICAWHRRAGKDLTFMHQTAKAAHLRKAAYWHLYPTFEQARKAIWEGFTREGKRIVDSVFPPEIVARRDSQQMMLELKCGSIWRLIGTDKVENVGAGPAGVVFSEFSLCRPSSWDFVRPMLRENGGWAAFIFTPRGRNHAHRLYQQNKDSDGWLVDTKTVHDTGLQYESVQRPGTLLTPDEMMAEERAEGMEEALIRQEYLCDFSAALVGSVWGDLVEALEKAGGLAEFEPPTDGVFTSWDLGVSDATAIWFWRLRDGTVDVIDHYESTGKPLSHYMDEVEARGYQYVKHWLPHDARARTLQTGISVIEQVVKRWGVGRVAIAPELSFPDGIQAARWLLQQGVRIHPRCGEGIEALRQYHYAWDEDHKVFARKPEHDWSSHSADAWRYLACVVRASELVSRKPDNPKRGPVAVPVDGSMTLERLWEENEQGSGQRRRI